MFLVALCLDKICHHQNWFFIGIVFMILYSYIFISCIRIMARIRIPETWDHLTVRYIKVQSAPTPRRWWGRAWSPSPWGRPRRSTPGYPWRLTLPTPPPSAAPSSPTARPQSTLCCTTRPPPTSYQTISGPGGTGRTPVIFMLHWFID